MRFSDICQRMKVFQGGKRLFLSLAFGLVVWIVYDNALINNSGIQERSKNLRHNVSNINLQNTKEILLHRQRRSKNKSDDKTNFLLTNISRFTNIRIKDGSKYTPSNVLEECQFQFKHKTELQKAAIKFRRRFHVSTSLYFIRILPDGSINKSEDVKVNNRMFEWQIVEQGHSVIMQLPVDLDLLTFGLLNAYEKDIIKLSVSAVDEQCTITNWESAIHSMRTLLSTHLFFNASDAYLCNRNYAHNTLREFIYYVTTVWVGYDMNCSSINNYLIEDSTFVLGVLFETTVPFLCYYLSLQFVWICKLIETENLETAYGDYVSRSFPYKLNDRPYGFHRILLKLFHHKIFLKCKSVSCPRGLSRVLSHLVNIPIVRLVTIMLIFVLPIAVYRTAGRHNLDKEEFNEYKYALRSSEPLCSLFFYNGSIMTCDIAYSLFFSLFGMVVFAITYLSFTKNNFTLLSFFVRENSTNQLPPKACERFLARLQLIRRLFNCLFETIGHCCCCAFVKRSSDSRPECSSTKDIFYNILNTLLILVEIVFQFITCFLPIISFACAPISTSLKAYRCSDRSSRHKVVFTLTAIILNPVFIIFYFRSIISTFIFPFRCLTYMFFVVLPLSKNLFQNFAFIIAICLYIVYYYLRVVSLHKEILDTLRKYMEIQQVTEHHYSLVVKNLSCVRNQVYWLILKSIIIYIYLSITLQTLHTCLSSVKTVTTLQESFGYFFILISPYAASLYFKNDDKYLTDDHKEEIRDIYNNTIRQHNPAMPQARRRLLSDEDETNV